MVTQNSKVDNFIAALREDPKNSGKFIKNLIRTSNRFLINLPVVGIARKITRELENGPFSYFYIFRRTLAHKLHPNLYALNLNIFSNYSIEKQYHKKYQQYENMIPHLAKKISHTSAEAKLHLLQKLRNPIISMVEHDGHFMVVKFYDYFLHKIDPKTARLLRTLELQVHFCKKSLSGDSEKNASYIKTKFQKFLEKCGNEYSLLFIERLTMDNKLQEYSSMLISDKKSSESSLTKKVMSVVEDLSEDLASQIEQVIKEETNEQPQKKKKVDEEQKHIIAYARKIKQAYLHQVANDDNKRITRIINNIKAINVKQLGKEKTDELVCSLIEVWLNDNDMPEPKKQILQNILESHYTRKVREIAGEAGIRLRLKEQDIGLDAKTASQSLMEERASVSEGERLQKEKDHVSKHHKEAHEQQEAIDCAHHADEILLAEDLEGREETANSENKSLEEIVETTIIKNKEQDDL
jgi:hypothetical protein